MNFFVSIDPGYFKSGIILSDISRKLVLKGEVVKSELLADLIIEWSAQYEINKIILGNGTSSNYIFNQLERKDFSNIQLVDERETTLRAKYRFIELWPPIWPLNLIPKSLRIVRTNLDAVAALLLLEDFLGYQLIWDKRPSFKI